MTETHPMAANLPLLPNLIDGGWAEAARTGALDLPDPASGVAFAQVPLSDPNEVDRAVRSARRAFPGWRDTPVADRARLLARFRDLLEADGPELARRVSRENGKTIDEARGSIRRGIEAVEFAISAPTLLQGSFLPNVSKSVDSQLSLEPVGVVAGITPFNFPVMVPLWMAPLALACGNTFVLKPSERVPQSAERLAQLFQSAGLPRGVFNLVHGARATVEAILDHPGVDAVAFVGSAPVAKEIYARGAAHGKRVLALAGAKNHLIVMPDAVLDPTVDAIMSSAFGSAGERCLAASVIVSVDPVGDRLVPALAERVRSLRVGPGDVAGTEMGPVIRAEHRRRVEEYVATGEAEGARVVARGATPAGAPGFFCAPVLLDEVRPEMRIAKEEIFGPVLSVIRCRSLDEAIDLANRSHFGNAAAVFTSDGKAAREFSRRIEAGMVGINIGVPAPAATFPFVGWKGSVYGAQAATGAAAVSFYTRTKVVTSRWF
ncbi:MAG: CoA-acylating methylmalonate-semialdehyde dehydrogenase [Thermoplasmata archaeon]|nr:CoA-acylating methylmalonate-semialdehyde dehydrogenase [Thermoplasmata archaeon]MCI4353828.1 CoA-acylating methylmalonate-semialdehyde dehydrogenase [Thermoplasmata archaeon]